MNSIIDDCSLASAGAARMHWFRERMPIVAGVNRMFNEQQTFKGKTVAVCMHIEQKPAIGLKGCWRAGQRMSIWWVVWGQRRRTRLHTWHPLII